jgi:hypothetical protein
MSYWLALAALALLLPDAPARKKPAPRPSSAVRTLTGCLDQRGESYVLTGDRELRRIVTLEGDGFSNDNFARYLGHKVKLQGRLASREDNAAFRVREIATVSETCKPDEP